MAEQPKLLVPREEDDRLALELQGTGIPLVCAPVTQRIPTPSEEWSDPIRRLQDGEYEWVVVSSVATARFLDEHYVLDELFANTRVAAIGAASANAMRELGVKVELVGPEPASAATLVSVFPEGSGAVFLPCAAGAAPTLGQGLSEKGWTVEKLRLYESVEIEELPVSWEAALSRRSEVFVLVTAGSVARAAHHLLTKTGVVQWPVPLALGAASAQACRELGWSPAAVCATADVEGISAAYADALEQLEKKRG